MTFAVRRTLPLLLCLALAGACDCGGDDGGRDGGGGGGDGSTDGSGNDGAADGSGNDGASDGNTNPDVVLPPPPDVHVLITADNAYAFGYGTGNALETYFPGVEDGSDAIFLCSQACGPSLPACDTGSCDAFGTCNEDRMGPETYTVPGSTADSGDYLYIVTWSDENTTQGLIAQFRASDGSNVVYTGDDEWEVCATGEDFDLPGPEPDTAKVNEWIGKCNQGMGFSQGWISDSLDNNPNAMGRGLVVLPPADDDTIGRFDELCRRPGDDVGDAIDPAAAWMWFDDDVGEPPNAFTNTSDDPRGDFLIFRLPISAVIIIE